MQPDVTPFFTIATTSSGLPSIAISSGRNIARADTNHHSAGLQGTGGTDRLGRFVQRACPHVRRDTTAYRGQRRRSTCQRALVASRSDGVPRTSQTLLGSPFLGEGLLLHYQRQQHRRGDTSVSQVS